MCLLIKKLFVMTFSLLFWTNSFIVQLGLGFKLITKVGLHNFPPPDPPFSPPQTFSQLKAMEKGKTFQEDKCLPCMVFFTKPNLINQTKPEQTKPNQIKLFRPNHGGWLGETKRNYIIDQLGSRLKSDH